MGRLDGKVAIVTGASRGIGKSIAELFAQEGASVVCVARTLNEGDHMLEGSLQSTVESIGAAGGKAVIAQADISSEEGCDAVIAAAHQAFGPVDVLVNNAALNYYVPIKDYAINRWMRAFAVNVHGPFMLSQKVLPDMAEKHAGASSISRPVRRWGPVAVPTSLVRCVAAPCTAPARQHWSASARGWLRKCRSSASP